MKTAAAFSLQFHVDFHQTKTTPGPGPTGSPGRCSSELCLTSANCRGNERGQENDPLKGLSSWKTFLMSKPLPAALLFNDLKCSL